MEYTHLALNKEYHSISGFYVPDRENRIKYKGRDVLYVTGQACAESSCCGSGNWCYVTVPGYVINWQYKRNEAGLPVSDIETIKDQQDKDAIRQVIQEMENGVTQHRFLVKRTINYWSAENIFCIQTLLVERAARIGCQRVIG